MPVPIPTPIYRILHIDNLHVCLKRRKLHAPNHNPNDGLIYRPIHNLDIQNNRRTANISCGLGGVIHDYVPFYFGPRSPMLLQLHTDRVEGYDEGQEPLIYLVSSVQAVQESGESFVFSDGHGIAAFTKWFDDVQDLKNVDWDSVYATYWKDVIDAMDRQRRKQAEFLIYKSCSWDVIEEIAVLNKDMEKRVVDILSNFDKIVQKDVKIHREWYY